MNKAQRQALVNRQVFKLLQMLLRLTIQHMPFFIWQACVRLSLFGNGHIRLTLAY